MVSLPWVHVANFEAFVNVVKGQLRNAADARVLLFESDSMSLTHPNVRNFETAGSKDLANNNNSKTGKVSQPQFTPTNRHRAGQTRDRSVSRHLLAKLVIPRE
ncbi:hypothetical protein L596_025475 [Steinernema carpocapsae]|uniref:Uncharacterized protein n=1 Tax=Steinernema carpocapsae TaxID=34508 RepID=A0A4U5M7V3_STECR|nr:hypothetical protein L596_025475 [Steinernema carpocapsae]